MAVNPGYIVMTLLVLVVVVSIGVWYYMKKKHDHTPARGYSYLELSKDRDEEEEESPINEHHETTRPRDVNVMESAYFSLPIGNGQIVCNNNGAKGIKVSIPLSRIPTNDNKNASDLNLADSENKSNFLPGEIIWPEKYWDRDTSQCVSIRNLDQMTPFVKSVLVSVGNNHPVATWMSTGKPYPNQKAFYFYLNGMYDSNLKLKGTVDGGVLTTMAASEVYRVDSTKAKIAYSAKYRNFQRSIILTLNDESSEFATKVISDGKTGNVVKMEQEKEIWDMYTPIYMSRDEVIINLKTVSIKLRNSTNFAWNVAKFDSTPSLNGYTLPYDSRLKCFYDHNPNTYTDRGSNFYLYFVNNAVPFECGIDYYYNNFICSLQQLKLSGNVGEIKRRDGEKWKSISNEDFDLITSEYIDRNNEIKKYLIKVA